jgi:four helix bundle protein
MLQFGHETLNVYQESIRFITWINELLEALQKNLSVHNQLDRASTSIPLNIAEGNGKHTSADRCRYFDISRFSTRMCCLPGCSCCKKDA